MTLSVRPGHCDFSEDCGETNEWQSTMDVISYPYIKTIGEENGNPLQYSCPENHMDGGPWQATVQGVARVRHDLVMDTTLRPLEKQHLDHDMAVSVSVEDWLQEDLRGCELALSKGKAAVPRDRL